MRCPQIAAAILAVSTVVAAQQQRPPAGLEVLPVAGNVYLFAGTGANVGVQAGEEGAIVVDSSTEAASEPLIAEIRKLTKYPIRYVINTADAVHVEGNDKIASAGLNFATPVPSLAGVGAERVGWRSGGGGPRTTRAQVYAHEAVLNRMSAQTAGTPPMPFVLWPTDTFFTAKKTLYFNGEPIELLHVPAAHTDGDDRK